MIGVKLYKNDDLTSIYRLFPCTPGQKNSGATGTISSNNLEEVLAKLPPPLYMLHSVHLDLSLILTHQLVADWACLLQLGEINQRPVEIHLREGIPASSLSMAKDNKVSTRPGFRFSAGRSTGKQGFRLSRKRSSSSFPRQPGRTDQPSLCFSKNWRKVASNY